MCAISGILGLPWEEAVMKSMIETMHRRGPDERGCFHEDDTLLLHTRLAIVDPEGGKQPMALTWDQETYVLVYNGELYNTEELRRQLTAAGHRFRSHSDTEVLLHAYAEYGEDCLRRLNGIFSFAVWEKKRRRLFLARDRIGVKPLFYLLHQHGLLFASEIKTILAYPGVKAQLDREGASELLLLGPGRMPGSGVFRNIRELEPGCCGYFENARLELSRYWKLRDREHRESYDETVECVRYLVQDAITRQMVSDAPIGTFLSGGLDSSIITAVCAKAMESRGETLKTFSVDYQNNDQYFQANKFQPNSDGDYIRLMQKKLHTDHHWSILTPEDLIDRLEAATIARDLPGMADVDFSLLAFCGDVRREVKVALSGECADEIFGGYPWYRDPEIRLQEGFPWAQNVHQRAKLLNPGIADQPIAFVMDAYTATCQASDILPGTAPTERRIKELVNLNFNWFMQTLLDRKDRMSMYHGLEVRVPFCDYRIAEYLYGVPWAFKEHRGQEKGLLRNAVTDLLPEEVLYRKKSPYPKTFDPAYEEIAAKKVEKLLLEDSPVWHVVSKKEARNLLTMESPWPWYGQLMRRPQTLAYFLQLDFWLRHYEIEMCF
ncbi:MAG: asparagine synthase (glutamine-hydrolyzing) [Oscillospiraceae bacterium]|nr:asparagine synthase (glutamine-hydrolyzing) [Oscillospiraceae bacterium]